MTAFGVKYKHNNKCKKMKTKNYKFFMFNKAKYLIFCSLFCFALLSFDAYSATNNGCSDDDNNRINPEIALCSTHVYNIGDTTNPTDEANKQVMRDVIALKTTVITQQLEQQYDFLEATVKRLKTQLQKAVLTTKLEASGASSGSSSSSSTSRDRNVVLIGAENCMLKSSTSDGLSCIQNNIRIVLQAVSAGNIGEAYRQLQKDIEFAEAYSVSGVVYDTDSKKLTQPEACSDTKLKAQRDSVNNCAYALNIAVMQAIEDQQNKYQQNINAQQR